MTWTGLPFLSDVDTRDDLVNALHCLGVVSGVILLELDDFAHEPVLEERSLGQNARSNSAASRTRIESRD